MADDDDNSQTVRRVYVLPVELADRIVAYQKARKLPSEVEAARRLLDAALKQQDSPTELLDRCVEALKASPDPLMVAREILIGHPLLEHLGQHDDGSVRFDLRRYAPELMITKTGELLLRGDSGMEWRFYDDAQIPF